MTSDRRISEGIRREVPTKPNIIVRVSPDRMEATIQLQPTGPLTVPPRKEDISAALMDNGIAYGINRALIDELCVRPSYYRVFAVARADPPQKGADGYVEYLFGSERGLRPAILADGTADYRDTGFVLTAQRGQTLCRIHGAKQGAAGYDIHGTRLDGLYGRGAINPVGKNTALNFDGSELIALVNGHVKVRMGTVNVYEILTLRGVDNSTGNIRFMGDVVVRGDVASGFTVKSEGSITIKGSVEGSTLEAGDAISVSAGIFGTEKSSVQAGGDIKCAFIQNSKVISSGNIYADSILFSDVRCGGSLILSGKNGVLAGGRARVAGGVEAKTIGSRGYAATEISIMPDANEKPPEIIKLEELIKELQEEEEEIIEMLAGKNSATGAPKAGAVNTGELIAATQRCGECIKQRGLAEKHLKKLYSRHETALREKCAVHCGEAIYPNTKIRIRGKTLIIDDELPSCIVRLADDGIGIEA